MSQLSPSAIFSPSVARQQLAAAKDWNYVDGWLSNKFNGKPPPPFERNNDTLKALLTLAALNENADEERDLLSKVEANLLTELQTQEAADSSVELLNHLEDNLTHEGHTGLDVMSVAANTLDEPCLDLNSIARRILDLQFTSADLDQANSRITILQDHLSWELQTVKRLLGEINGTAYQLPAELSKQILEQQRMTKVLAAKLPDLRDRVAALSIAAGIPNPTIEEVKLEEVKFTELSVIVKTLESHVKSYHGLPHDTDLARLALESLRIELRDLTRMRDAIFEALVESDSPRRQRNRSTG